MYVNIPYVLYPLQSPDFMHFYPAFEGFSVMENIEISLMLN